MTSARRESKLRVTQVLYSGLGGHASVAFSLIGGDTGLQWLSSLLFVGVEPLLPAFRNECLDREVPFDAVQSRKRRPWVSWPVIYKALRELQPDVVILHSVSSFLPVALYCLRQRARLVTVEHTPHALKSRAERVMSGLALYLSRSVVVLTEGYRAEHLKAFRWTTSYAKVVVIPNGIDVEQYSRKFSRVPDGTVRIGMAARFSATKRQDLLISALLMLQQRYPETRWRMSLAGDGDCRGQAAALAARLGVVQAVELPGNLDQEALVRWFHSLDLYAHASEGEALSTSMLQAMAMGLPMAASSVPGITNLLAGEEAPLGVLVSENTAEAFAAGLGELASAPQLQEEMAGRARTLVANTYSQETMFQSYNALIMGLPT